MAELNLQQEAEFEPEGDDFLEHPESLVDDADDEETAELRALFPSGPDEKLERAWSELFTDEEVDRRFAQIVSEETLRGAPGAGYDTGIATRLRAKGLRVVEVAGWTTRGSSSFFPLGSVDHHTAGPLSGNSPSLGICINGRSDLPGPLCNVFIARDNTCYVVAAGRANHAGTGTYRGLSGNSRVYGVEHENTGIGNEPWREDQRTTAALVHAALLEGIGRDHTWVCQHKEWTTRKIDKWDQAGEDMRLRVAVAMQGGSAPAPAPTPGIRNLYLTSPMMRGQDVKDWQTILIAAGHLPKGSDDGIFGPATKAATAKFQQQLKLNPDGIVGPATRKAVDDLFRYLAWLEQQKNVDHSKERVKEIQRLVRTPADGIWGPNTNQACLRHMISWRKRGRGITNEPPIVVWLQRQGNRKFGNRMAEDGLVGPATNHLIVVQLGQRDEICGPNGYRKAAA